MNRKTISQKVDGWIAEQDLPPSPRLKVIRKFDDLYPADWDEDEFEAYWEFISKGLAKDYELLLSLPKPDTKCEFWPFQFDESGNDESPFNTVDFKNHHPYEFSKEHYRVKKVYEKVKDYAIAYSTARHRLYRTTIYGWFKDLVETEFRDWAVRFSNALRKTTDPVKKDKLKRKLFTQNHRIQKCNEIWRKYAYWE